MSESKANPAEGSVPIVNPTIQAAYAEVCRTYIAVDDFRAKLLAFLPLVSGSGGALLLANKGAVNEYLGPIGLFGSVVTVGLFCYELRGLNRCSKLVAVGERLEGDLKLRHGQFLSHLEDKALGFIGATAAALIIYGAVLSSWIYVASVGFR